MISQQLRISTGVENFSLLRDTGCVYVDKTLFLKELFDGPAMSQVSFFLRPRRFGKTLTLSMIQNFLQINYRDPEDLARHHQLFKDLAVAEDRDFCEAFMGRYPVLSFSLKCADAPNFEFAVRGIFNDLLLVWSEFSFLADKTVSVLLILPLWSQCEDSAMILSSAVICGQKIRLRQLQLFPRSCAKC